MKFHLNYTPVKYPVEISHRDAIMMIGSCFSDNISNLMKETKFEVFDNPSGILFNPLSIYNCLKDILQNKPFDEKFIVQRGSEYFSFLHHSSFKDATKEKLVEKINRHNQHAFDYLRSADFLFITFGSAFYFHHLGLETGVANCHKQPGSMFNKRMLPVNVIVSEYSALIRAISQFNPKLKIIFTVSPVKYLKDGLVENNISKSTLLLSVNELSARHDNCFYFPAYELVADDLRDYRFYKEDMAHPNDQAIHYVWDKFSDTYFSDKTKELNKLIGKLNTALSHRKLHDHPDEKEKFEKHLSEMTEEIRKIEPGIRFS